MKNKKFPKIIQEVGFDFSWDEEKIWKLKVPVTEMNIKELTWQFDIPIHGYSDELYNLSPAEIIKNPEKYAREYERTMKVDLKYPIDIMENKGRWLILDGIHRLMKAHILKMKKVKVRIIPREEIPEIIKAING